MSWERRLWESSRELGLQCSEAQLEDNVLGVGAWACIESSEDRSTNLHCLELSFMRLWQIPKSLPCLTLWQSQRRQTEVVEFVGQCMCKCISSNPCWNKVNPCFSCPNTGESEASIIDDWWAKFDLKWADRTDSQPSRQAIFLRSSKSRSPRSTKPASRSKNFEAVLIPEARSPPHCTTIFQKIHSVRLLPSSGPMTTTSRNPWVVHQSHQPNRSHGKNLIIGEKKWEKWENLIWKYSGGWFGICNEAIDLIHWLLRFPRAGSTRRPQLPALDILPNPAPVGGPGPLLAGFNRARGPWRSIHCVD